MKGLRLGIAVWLLVRALLLGAVPLSAQAALPRLEARGAWKGMAAFAGGPFAWGEITLSGADAAWHFEA